jgi:hypothetical protein
MRRVVVLIVFAALALGVGGWPSASTASTATTTTVSKAAKLEKGDKYVSLGSSLASGFGIANQSTPCGRSDKAYGPLVAARFGLQLTDVSCGAAVVPNIVDRSQGANPPQIDAVTPETTSPTTAPR